VAADDVKDVKRASLACALTRIFVLVSEGTEPYLATDVPLRAFDHATEDLRAAALVLDAALVKYARCPPTFRMRAGEAAASLSRTVRRQVAALVIAAVAAKEGRDAWRGKSCDCC